MNLSIKRDELAICREQHQQWKRIWMVERQQHTVERVDSVEEQLHVYRHMRIQASEESLQRLQLSQSSFAEGLHLLLKRDLQEEPSWEFPSVGREHVQAVTSEPTRGMLPPTAVQLTGLLVGAVAVDACRSVIRSIALCPLIVAHPIHAQTCQSSHNVLWSHDSCFAIAARDCHRVWILNGELTLLNRLHGKTAYYVTVYVCTCACSETAPAPVHVSLISAGAQTSNLKNNACSNVKLNIIFSWKSITR